MRTSGTSLLLLLGLAAGCTHQQLAPDRHPCDLGADRSLTACRRLALREAESADKDVRALGRAHFGVACDGGDLLSCGALGMFLFKAEDFAGSADLVRRGCEGGLAIFCSIAGYLYLEGNDVPHDATRARALLQRGCDGGDAMSCASLGRVLARLKEWAQASALFRRACDGSIQDGCVNLGGCYQNGTGVDKDERKAADLFLSACVAKEPRGCLERGHQAADGDLDGEVDDGLAVGMFERACEGREGIGCRRLGILTEEGRGGPPDSTRARALYQRACDGGDEIGCRLLHTKRMTAAEMASFIEAPYRHFNEQLFDSKLPRSAFRLTHRAAGIHRSDATAAGTRDHVIALNPVDVALGGAKLAAAVLVHEMVHLWQEEQGTRTQGLAHNQEWADKMESLGLMPSATGSPGGARTGRHMAEYVIAGGDFERAFGTLPH